MTKTIKRINLRGTVIIALISISFGPTAREREMKNQQNKLAKNSGAAKELGSPS